MSALQLTDEELLALADSPRTEVQAAVAAARARLAARDAHPDLTPEQAGFIADAVGEAERNGLLVWAHTPVTHCGLCGKSAGYVRYKSGPRKGEANYGRPLVFAGIELAERSVRVQHHIVLGGCADCVKPLAPILAETLRDVEAQVPDPLRAPGQPGRTRYRLRRCTVCGWQGHEGQMGRVRAAFGGTFPGGCPSCGVEDAGFAPSHFERVEGFAVVMAGVSS